MTIPPNNVDSSSSATPSEVTDALSAFDNLPPLELILSYIKEDMSSLAYGERGI
ncbi:hypothetical protein A2U01_0067755, partial [Trifolium medium]|nr:hypothetical protein [Trifolium medium]